MYTVFKNYIKLFFTFLIIFCTSKSLSALAIISPNTRHDLSIKSLCQVIDKTHTSDGFLQLEKLITPIHDLKVITARQTTIKYLFENQELYTQLFEELQKIAQIDRSWWNKYTQIEKDITALFPKQMLFPTISWGKQFPSLGVRTKDLTSLPSWVFDACFALKQYSLLQYLMVIIGLGQASTQAAINYALSTHNIDITHTLGLKEWIKSVFDGMTIPLRALWPYNIKFDSQKTYPNPLEAAYSLFSFLGGSFRDVVDCFALYLKNIRGKSTTTAYAISIPTVAFFTAFRLHGYATQSKTFVNQSKQLHTTLSTCKTYFKQLKAYLTTASKIAKLIEKQSCPELKIVCAPLLHALKNGSATLKELFILLQSSTFKKNESMWYRRGVVVRTAFLYLKARQEIAEIIETIGLLDAYLSCATLLKEFSTKSVHFCFAEFDPQANSIACSNMWLPTLLKNTQLSSEQIITNSVSYGEHTPNKALICGPNGSGKSMVLKGIGVGVVLAQSIGIFPADKAILPVFDTVATCINPEEDSAHGLSQFGSELLALENLQKIVNDCQHKNSKALILFDEPCRGTHPQETARRFGDFCLAAMNINQATLLCTSHSNELVQMLLPYPTLFGLQHMEILESTPHQFVQTYKLRTGIAPWWFTDIKKRAAYVDWFIENVVKKNR